MTWIRMTWEMLVVLYTMPWYMEPIRAIAVTLGTLVDAFFILAYIGCMVREPSIDKLGKEELYTRVQFLHLIVPLTCAILVLHMITIFEYNLGYPDVMHTWYLSVLRMVTGQVL